MYFNINYITMVKKQHPQHYQRKFHNSYFSTLDKNIQNLLDKLQIYYTKQTLLNVIIL